MRLNSRHHSHIRARIYAVHIHRSSLARRLLLGRQRTIIFSFNFSTYIPPISTDVYPHEPISANKGGSCIFIDPRQSLVVNPCKSKDIKISIPGKYGTSLFCLLCTLAHMPISIHSLYNGANPYIEFGVLSFLFQPNRPVSRALEFSQEIALNINKLLPAKKLRDPRLHR